MLKGLYQKHKHTFWHFVKFMIVGAINFGVDIGVLALLNQVLGLWLIPANIISYTCGVINSFLLNRYWTFKIRHSFFSVHFAKFVFINLISLGVNTLAVAVLKDLYHLDLGIAKLLATVFSFTVNFAGNKLLVFKEDGTKKLDNPK